MMRPQRLRAIQLFIQADLSRAHFDAIRSVGMPDAGKAQLTQTGYGRNRPEIQRLADEAKRALRGYNREFTYGITYEEIEAFRAHWASSTDQLRLI